MKLKLILLRSFEQENIDYGIDKLTGCYNKSNFYSKISEKLLNNNDKKYAIIRFDVDKFKVINEAYGEMHGDNVLIIIS